MLFHGRQNAQVALYSPGVVVLNVGYDHSDEFLLAGKMPAVIAFPLQDAPEALHRAIVNAVCHARHILRHSGFLKLVVKSSNWYIGSLCHCGTKDGRLDAP